MENTKMIKILNSEIRKSKNCLKHYHLTLNDILKKTEKFNLIETEHEKQLLSFDAGCLWQCEELKRILKNEVKKWIY